MPICVFILPEWSEMHLYILSPSKPFENVKAAIILWNNDTKTTK